jgi:ribosome-binding factor A
MTRRTERIGEQLRGEIAKALRKEVTDPRIQLVTLTRVDVAPDLSNALVYWSSMTKSGHTGDSDGHPPDHISQAREAELADIGRGLESAAGFLRTQIARKLPNLRRTPALRFRHDTSLELGSRTLDVLRTLNDGEKS